MFEEKKKVSQGRLRPSEEFKFACRSDLECFNSCCRDKRLPLWPYDVVRLSRALGAGSSEVLAGHADLEIDPGSGWPALRLRLDEAGRCPFVSENGCRVYPHRPACCRLYPLQRAAALRQGRIDVIYSRIETSGCLGWDQDRAHTIETWADDQGLEEYNRANDAMLPLFTHPKKKGRLELAPRQIHAVIAALYNLDAFRQAVEQPGFRQRFSRDRIDRALESDEELLLLGRDFLIKELFPS